MSALIPIICTALLGQAGPDFEFIFPLQDKHVHSSSIVVCPNGDLLATWFHGSGERKANDVQIQGARKRKGADAWGPVFTMADTPDLPDCNPILYIDDQDRLWLFWMVIHTNRWERSILKYRRASNYSDDGPPAWDWQDIILLKPGEGFSAALEAGFKELGYGQEMWSEHARAYDDMLVDAAKDPVKTDTGWMTRTNIIKLSSGRIILPLYSDGFNVSLAALSDDGGETWQASAPIVGLGNVQPAIAQRSNGTLVAYHRDNGDAPKRILEATSTDDGATWSVARDMDIPNPGSSVALRAFSNGDWIMVANDTEGGRHRISVFLSTDEGETWSNYRVLESADPGVRGYGYPSIVEGEDGLIHITYSYSGPDGASIRHTTLTANRIGRR